MGEHRDPDIRHVEDAPIAGTSSYMAPEQLEGNLDALGPWTDVYLLGAVLYEVIQARLRTPGNANPSGAPLPAVDRLHRLAPMSRVSSRISSSSP